VPRLALHLLGPPKIECDGTPVKLDRRKAVALLAYLAVTAESHPRDTLVNLLWPELDSTRGRAALRRTLYSLNQALTGPWLDADREEIGLAPGPTSPASPEPGLWVDVVHFRRLLAQCEAHGHPTSQVCPACVPLLSEAVDLGRGEFLSGFSLKDSVNFDDWQLHQAEVLRRELIRALERLVDWHSDQHEFEPAAGYARRKLALDPLDEDAHCQLMCLYAWLGQRSFALRQYEECARGLEEQLGVPPQEATTELYRAIQAGRAPAPPGEVTQRQAPVTPVQPPPFLMREVPVERPIFVARESELASLDRHLRTALAGQGRVVFVTGEAGSGKTALLQEFTRRAQETHSDLVVASGNCNAYTGLGDPYLPFRQILDLLTGDVRAKWAAGTMTREHARRLWHALPHAVQALADAGPALVDTFVSRTALLERAMAYAPQNAGWLAWLSKLQEHKPASLGIPGTQQTALFDHYTRVLQALALRMPLVLLLDDLHWADAGSISLLFHLGRQLAGSPILIVGTYRPEEVVLGRCGKRHPLEPVANELQREFGQIAVDLDRAEGRDFVAAFLDSEPNRLVTEFRDMLYGKTRGHPLFTIELLRGLQDRGELLRDPQGCWVEGPSLDWETLPARVEAVIAERIGRLGQPLRDALRIACVEGEDFTAEVVARVLSTGEQEMVQRLSAELDRRHHLVRAQALELVGAQRVSRFRFRHSLFQRYLYDHLTPAERAYLHEDVGNVLEELYGDRASDIAVQLARHFQEANTPDKAIHYLHQAGERAVQQSAYQEGIAHLSRGLALSACSKNLPYNSPSAWPGCGMLAIRNFEIPTFGLASYVDRRGRQLSCGGS
jgi:DNA-binding SARP family transcriptional activator